MTAVEPTLTEPILTVPSTAPPPERLPLIGPLRIRDFAGALVDVHATLMFVVAGLIIVAAVGIGLVNGVAPRMREEGTA